MKESRTSGVGGGITDPHISYKAELREGMTISNRTLDLRAEWVRMGAYLEKKEEMTEAAGPQMMQRLVNIKLDQVFSVEVGKYF